MVDFIERDILELLKRSEQQHLDAEQVLPEIQNVEVVGTDLDDFDTAQEYIDYHEITDDEIISRVKELKA